MGRQAPSELALSDFFRRIPLSDLRDIGREDVLRALAAGLAVAFLAVPQGVAYAIVANVPPAMGLYTATFPTIVGSLLRSSRHVITGPTNAVSLLVGAAVASGIGPDPVQSVITLAFMVGVLEIAAVLLRLDVLVHYISHPVVVGYITGAAILIMVGQLPAVTATPSTDGHIPHQIAAWLSTLDQADGTAVAMAAGTAAMILAIRRLFPRVPSASVAIIIAVAITIGFELEAQGLPVVRSKSAIPNALPSLTVPDLSLIGQLLSLSVAVTLLSLVESTSIARSLASKTGQRIQLPWEIAGEGAANLTASLCGGYPTTGSLTRSALNHREGATSRLAGVFAGVFVLLALLLLGSVLNSIPLAALAGLLLTVAFRLIDGSEIRQIMASHSGDRLAFLLTLAGTFLLHLDQAIYLGVFISLAMFLRSASLISLRDLVVDSRGYLREVSARSRPTNNDHPNLRYGSHVHILNVAGSLFFGSAGELEGALDELTDREHLRVIVVRVKRARNLDVTTMQILGNTAQQLRYQGRRLVLVGLSASAYGYLERIGIVEVIGEENVFTTQTGRWFAALETALYHAFSLIDDDSKYDDPYARWLKRRQHATEPDGD